MRGGEREGKCQKKEGREIGKGGRKRRNEKSQINETYEQMLK